MGVISFYLLILVLGSSIFLVIRGIGILWGLWVLPGIIILVFTLRIMADLLEVEGKESLMVKLKKNTLFIVSSVILFLLFRPLIYVYFPDADIDLYFLQSILLFMIVKWVYFLKKL